LKFQNDIEKKLEREANTADEYIRNKNYALTSACIFIFKYLFFVFENF